MTSLRDARLAVSRLDEVRNRSLTDLRAWQEAGDRLRELEAAAAAIDPEAIRREAIRSVSRRSPLIAAPWRPEKRRRVVSRTVVIEKY